MNSKITNGDINKFLIKVYFGEIKEPLLKNKIQTAINRAYLDFYRTLRDIKKINCHDEIINNSKQYLLSAIILFIFSWHCRMKTNFFL